jgi:hypothetical protein
VQEKPRRRWDRGGGRGGFTQKRRMRQYTKTSPITVLNAFEGTCARRQQISRPRLVHTLRKQSSGGVESITTGTGHRWRATASVPQGDDGPAASIRTKRASCRFPVSALAPPKEIAGIVRSLQKSRLRDQTFILNVSLLQILQIANVERIYKEQLKV